MFAFLERQFQLSPAEEIGALLGSMALLPDGQPTDPALASQWSQAVSSVLRGFGSAEFKITGP
jgi:hypothetical protein